jgi:hypothetical protein
VGRPLPGLAHPRRRAIREQRAPKPGRIAGEREMNGETQDFEEGDRVAIMRVAPLTGDIQIIEATVVGMVDEYQVVVHFPGGTDLTLPVGEVTRMPRK